MPPLPLTLVVALLTGVLSAFQAEGEADRLYADRETLQSAQRAAALWDTRATTDRGDYEAAWKLARACYWLGGHVPHAMRRAELERGLAAAKRAVEIDPARPDGHFWMAANMGALAESFGLRAGLRYRGSIKEALETVLRIDPAFQQGSADRALGRWYYKVPGLFGGSRDRAIEHLQRSLRYNPASTATHFFLAEVFVDMKRQTEAQTSLRAVLDAPLDPEWAPEDREFKAKAAALLRTLSPPR